MKSILSNQKVCYKCGTMYNLHKHHIFYGAKNRTKSENEGCWVYLCANHHNMSKEGVHFDREYDLELKRECERKWLEVNNKTTDDFINDFGKNYL